MCLFSLCESIDCVATFYTFLAGSLALLSVYVTPWNLSKITFFTAFLISHNSRVIEKRCCEKCLPRFDVRIYRSIDEVECTHRHTYTAGGMTTIQVSFLTSVAALFNTRASNKPRRVNYINERNNDIVIKFRQ